MDPAGHTLLIVDDERFLAETLKRLVTRYLGMPHVAVRIAFTPEEARSVLASLDPNGHLVVLSDYNLNASITGLDLLKEIQGARPEARRVLMSGFFPEHVPADISSGLDRFIPKPPVTEELMATLRELMGERPASS